MFEEDVRQGKLGGRGALSTPIGPLAAGEIATGILVGGGLPTMTLAG